MQPDVLILSPMRDISKFINGFVWEPVAGWDVCEWTCDYDAGL
jgi:hypothetical protein